MYLSSVRVSIAEESVVDHRVQLQYKVYEWEGKYIEVKSIEAKSKSNEAQPSWTWTWTRWTCLRCTCLPTSQLCIQVGEDHVQLLMDFILVH